MSRRHLNTATYHSPFTSSSRATNTEPAPPADGFLWPHKSCCGLRSRSGRCTPRLVLLCPWIPVDDPVLAAAKGTAFKSEEAEGEFEWREPPGDPTLSIATGCFMMLSAAAFVLWELYAMCISKLMPYTGNWWLDAIKDDWYFCIFLPIGLGTCAIFIYWNWLALKIFRSA